MWIKDKFSSVLGQQVYRIETDLQSLVRRSLANESIAQVVNDIQNSLEHLKELKLTMSQAGI